MGRTNRAEKFGKTWIFIVIAGTIAVAIALFDWNWLRGPLSSYLSAKLGREVRIEGNFHVDVSTRPLLTAESVVLRNAPWSAKREMLRAERVSLRVDPMSLFRPPVALADVSFVRPRVLLEQNTDGRGNWELEGKTQTPRIHGLKIEDGVVHYVNPITSTDVVVNIASSAPSDTGETPVEFSGSGRLRNNPFTIQGTGASLLALENGDKPYHLDVHARAGDTMAQFDGTIVPTRIDDVGGVLTLQGRDLSQLYPIIPVPLPWTPAYRLHGRLEHHSAVWYFHDFNGKVGDSDVAGEFSLDRSKPRPLIQADLVSTRLDYEDLGGLVGLPPGEGAKKASTPAQKAAAAKQAQSNAALPTKPYDLERLRVVDAKVQFKGKRFVASDLPLDNMTARMDLEQGVLKLQPLDFGVAGGHVASTLVLDARGDVIKTNADITVDNVELKQILPSLKPPQGSAGKVAGRARFVASGNSVAKMLASSNGEAALISRGGDASALAVVLTNLDLASAVPLLLKGDRSSPIRCTVADLVADNGRVSAKTLVMDTDAEKIVGEGSVDFATERYDLKLTAQSKRPSIVALRGPILVDGSFKQPRVHPAAGPIVARIGAAVGLGMLAPPAAVLPLVDLGGSKDADCESLIVDAMQNVKTLKLASSSAAPRPGGPSG